MELQIGSVTIGDNFPCVVIPEGCDNHGGKLDTAKALAYAAKEAGAEIIKFQLHLPDEEMHREGMRQTSSRMFSKWGDLYGFIEANLLSVGDHAKLIEYCKEIGIQYFCTPFSSRAAEILIDLGGDAGFKIGSGETTDLLMLEDVRDHGRPMIISTGMSTMEEIDLTVGAMWEKNPEKQNRTPFALAHCISAYPPKDPSELHLGVISRLRRKYGVLVGLSDHTSPEGVGEGARYFSERETMSAALSQGACFVEKHFTLDRNADDADSNFSHDPQTLKRLIEDIKMVEEMLDDTREVSEKEWGVREWAHRSLVARVDISQGTRITRDMIMTKRPPLGILSRDYPENVGKTADRDIKAGEMLFEGDLVYG